MEKLASLARLGPSFATQPMVGSVSIGCAPAAFDCEMKSSPSAPGVALAEPILSKYQSAAWFAALICQL